MLLLNSWYNFSVACFLPFKYFFSTARASESVVCLANMSGSWVSALIYWVRLSWNKPMVVILMHTEVCNQTRGQSDLRCKWLHSLFQCFWCEAPLGGVWVSVRPQKFAEVHTELLGGRRSGDCGLYFVLKSSLLSWLGHFLSLWLLLGFDRQLSLTYTS